MNSRRIRSPREVLNQSQQQLEQRSQQRQKRGSKSMIVFGLVTLAIIYGYYDWLSGDRDGVVQQEKTAEEILAAEQVIAPVEDVIVDVVPVATEEGKNIVRYTVAEEDIPAEIFQAYGKMSFNDVEALLVAAEDVYDFTNVKIGKEFRFVFSVSDEKLERIEYVRDTESIVVAQKDGDDFIVRQEDIAYETERVTARGTITNSLYADALAQGMQERTVVAMAEMLAFDVNFFTDIQPGNEFVVHFEKRTLDGQEGPDGRIFAARYVGDDESVDAFSFDDGDGSGIAFYDGEGNELKKQFLQAPLSYSRISSGFTGARLHPITGRTTPHYQIDYAAPTGTPVIATANGVVTGAGWEGGWGRIVRLRHDNGYTTHYAHLSGIAKGVSNGGGVDQGQIVGFVGSTGWSTGPHLDYGMRQNGAPVNPLTLKQPKGNPLATDKLEIFKTETAEYKKILEG